MDEKETARRLAELEAREREVERREKALDSASGIKRNLYGRIACSARSVEIVIAVCALLIVGLMLYGIFGKCIRN